MTFTTFISPCSRIRAAPSLSESSVLSFRFVSTSDASRLYSSSSFESPDRSRRRPVI